jgi:hypothetical protein
MDFKFGSVIQGVLVVLSTNIQAEDSLCKTAAAASSPQYQDEEKA